MKKRDTIIITFCIATALICIALTWWGNFKNDGVLSPDAFYGVLATFIGICATIIVGFQIASFVKIHETERQIKEVQRERDKMLKEKEAFRKEFDFIENELSNAFVLLSETIEDHTIKALANIISLYSVRLENLNSNVILQRYKNLRDNIGKMDNEQKVLLSQQSYRLKSINIPPTNEHYTEIMKLHFECIEILENAETELNKNSD